MTTVLKLGGSVLTDKDSPETVDSEALSRAVGPIGKRWGNEHERDGLVLVHGGGSFGHPAAAAHGVSETDGTRDAAALTAIHRAMGRLNRVVVDELHAAGVSAVPVRPLSMVRRVGGTVECPVEPVASAVEEGLVPVLHGDVVVDEGQGGTVLSGDQLVVALARELGADRVGVCSTVPGVLDEDGEVIPEIADREAVAGVFTGSDVTDVTGGMAGKVQALLELAGPAAIFELEALGTFLDTGQAGTVVR